MSWRVHWQDWSRHITGTPPPKRHHEDHATETEARRRARSLRELLGRECIVSVMPTPAPRAKPITSKVSLEQKLARRRLT